MPHIIKISLSNLEELFKISEINAYVPRTNFESGFEHIYHNVSAENPKGSLTLEISTNSKTDLAQQEIIKENLKHFCQEKINLLAVKKKSRQKKALSTVLNGMLIMTACLSGAYLAENSNLLTGYLSFVVSEGLLIWAWISLWPTGEILLFEQWNFKHQMKIFKIIKEAHVKFY